MTESEETFEDTPVETKVTTIADEEAKTGEKLVPEMTEEQFISQVTHSHINLLKRAETQLKGLNAKQIRKAVIGALDVRQPDVPVDWIKKTGSKTAEVKPEFAGVFNLYQTLSRLQEATLLITNYQAKLNMLKHAQAQADAKEAERVKESTKSSEKNINSQSTEGE